MDYTHLGQVGIDFTFREIERTLQSIVPHFLKSLVSSQQRFFVTYDTRPMSEIYARSVSVWLSMRGFSVFLSNRPAPSSVMIVNQQVKNGLGTICITGDEESIEFLGIRVYDQHGFLMNGGVDFEWAATDTESEPINMIAEFKRLLRLNKIEFFDPLIIYQSVVNKKINFARIVPFPHRVLFNPMYGSGFYYFDKILSDQKIHGYTVDNQTMPFRPRAFTLQDEQREGVQFVPAAYQYKTKEDMVYFGCEYAFVASPDCTSFDFYNQNGQISFAESISILYRSLQESHDERKIFIHESVYDHKMDRKMRNRIEILNDGSFRDQLKRTDYAFAADEKGRLIWDTHAPDALMSGFHLLCVLAKEGDGV